GLGRFVDVRSKALRPLGQPLAMHHLHLLQDGGVADVLVRRHAFMDLSDRARAPIPEHAENFQFGVGRRRDAGAVSPAQTILRRLSYVNDLARSSRRGRLPEPPGRCYRRRSRRPGTELARWPWSGRAVTRRAKSLPQ